MLIPQFWWVVSTGRDACSWQCAQDSSQCVQLGYPNKKGKDENNNNNNYYYYSKPSLKQIPVLWLVLSRLGFRMFPWKRSNPCIFVLERSRQIQWLQWKHHAMVSLSGVLGKSRLHESQVTSTLMKRTQRALRSCSKDPPLLKDDSMCTIHELTCIW